MMTIKDITNVGYMHQFLTQCLETRDINALHEASALVNDWLMLCEERDALNGMIVAMIEVVDALIDAEMPDPV